MIPIDAYLSVGIGPGSTLVATSSVLVTSQTVVDVPFFTCVSLEASTDYYLTLSPPADVSPDTNVASWPCVQNATTASDVLILPVNDRTNDAGWAYSSSVGQENPTSPWLSVEVLQSTSVGFSVYSAPITKGPSCPCNAGYYHHAHACVPCLLLN